MSKLDQQLNTAVTSIPECLAAGCMDIGSGMPAVGQDRGFPSLEVLDLVAAATADMFAKPQCVHDRKNVQKVARYGRRQPPYFQRIIVNSDNLLHVFMRGKRYPDYVAVFVCRKSANLGMALTKARIAMPALEACF